MRYSWRSLDGWAAIPEGYNRKDLVLPPPVPAALGQQYRVELSTGFVGSSVSSTSVVTLVAAGPPLSAALDGPSGDVPEAWVVVLNASRSNDPADPSALLTYSWDCLRADFPVPCFNSSTRGTQAGAVWTIPGDVLAADVAHTFTVTVTRDTRSASAQVTLTPRAGVIPTGKLQRQCAASSSDGSGGCSGPHNTDQPLAIVLQLAPGAAESLTWQWQVAGQAMPGADNSTKLVIPADQLPGSGTLDISVALTNVTSSTSGATSIMVPLNPAPRCTAAAPGGCLVITTLSSTFGADRFQAAAVGVVDDGASLT
jgi:hypothetical protein